MLIENCPDIGFVLSLSCNSAIYISIRLSVSADNTDKPTCISIIIWDMVAPWLSRKAYGKSNEKKTMLSFAMSPMIGPILPKEAGRL